MKRIICTVSNDLTYDQRMIRICTSMANAGHEVILIGRVLESSKPLKDEAYAQLRIKLLFNKGKLFYLALNLRLLFKFLVLKYDIAYAVDLDTLIAVKIAASIRRRPVVYDAHEYFTEVPELSDRPISKRIWELIARLFIPNVNHAITVCTSLSDVFKARYGVKFEVVRNVPYLKESAVNASKPADKFIAIYQGALNDGRGLEESIAAMKLLNGVELWICGEGDLSTELRTLSAQIGVADRVKFLGKLTPNELLDITPKAHIGLNLLKNKGLNYYYSLANKAFDYLHAGLPSLNMAFPEYVRLNEQYDVFELINELEPAKIAAAISNIKTNQQRYAQLASNARKASLELNWQLESQKLLGVINSIE